MSHRSLTGIYNRKIKWFHESHRAVVTKGMEQILCDEMINIICHKCRGLKIGTII